MTGVAIPVGAAARYATARAWFAEQGFAPFAFQEQVWSAFAAGRPSCV
jgi:hypothetical protein